MVAGIRKVRAEERRLLHEDFEIITLLLELSYLCAHGF